MFVCMMNFELVKIAKGEVLEFSGPTCISKGYSSSILYVNVVLEKFQGTVLITSWKCNFSIFLDIQVYYLDIQAITTLYAFYWLFMCCFLLFVIFLPYNHSPEK